MGGRPEPACIVFATTATALGVGRWPLMYKPGTNRATIFCLCAKYLAFISRPFTNQRDGTDALLFFPSKIDAATISPSGFMHIFRPHPGWSHPVPGISSETSRNKRKAKRTNRRDTGNRNMLLESARRAVPGIWYTTTGPTGREITRHVHSLSMASYLWRRKPLGAGAILRHRISRARQKNCSANH